jgi:hypothetical protein
MPQLIGLLLLSAVGVTDFTIIAGVTLSQVIGTVVLTAGLMGLQMLLAPTAKPPKPEAGHQAIRQTIPERLMAYGGPVRVSGSYVLYEAYRGNSLDVISVVSAKICGFRRYFLHDDEVTIDVDGVVDSTPEFGDGRYVGMVAIGTRLGHATESAYADIIAYLPTGFWTSDHRGDGTASISLFCNGVKAEDFLKKYPHQHPEPSVVIDAVALWDPRDPAQDPDDPATWIDYPEWAAGTTYAEGDRVLFNGVPCYSRVDGNIGTPPWAFEVSPGVILGSSDSTVVTDNHEKWCSVINNPVLQWIDYYLNTDYGMALDREIAFPPSRIATLMVEADHCDALVQKKNLDYEPRYQCRMFFKFTNNPEDILGPMLATCDGWTAEGGDGDLSFVAGVYRAPTVTITHHHIIGFSISDGVLDEERVNELTLSYTSPEHKFKEVPGQAWRDEQNISETGVLRSQPLSITAVQSHSQLRRLSKRAMLRLQSPLTGRFTTKLYGLRILGERWIRVQYPFFPGMEDCVVEIQPNPEIDIVNQQVTFEWRIINPNTIDAWNAATEEGTAPPIPDGVEEIGLPVPQDLRGALNGSVGEGFRFDIDFEDPDFVGLTYAVRYALADDGSGNPGPWTQSKVGAGTLEDGRVLLTLFAPADSLFIVEVAAVGSLGTFSGWSDSLVITTDLSAITDNEGRFLLDNAGHAVSDNS